MDDARTINRSVPGVTVIWWQKDSTLGRRKKSRKAFTSSVKAFHGYYS